MLAFDNNVRFKDTVRIIASTLIGMRDQRLPSPVVKARYDHEPMLFDDLFPALTSQFMGWDRYGGESDETPFPGVYHYAIRVYYPIISDESDVDGLKTAQDMCLEGFDEWFMALVDDEQLGGLVRFAEAPSGRVRGVSNEPEKDVLYVIESAVRVDLH